MASKRYSVARLNFETNEEFVECPNARVARLLAKDNSLNRDENTWGVWDSRADNDGVGFFVELYYCGNRYVRRADNGEA